MRTIVRAILVLASVTASLRAADETQTAEQLYKNIQVLRGVPASELTPSMNLISSALGVRCIYCHTPRGPWPQGYEEDGLKTKQTAREMIRMTRQINETSFSGRTVVTCATCHTGHTHPAAFVPADTPEAIEAQIGQPAQPNTAPLPTAEELFAKYETAVGGEAAISRLTARHLIGTIHAGGQSARVEQFATSRGLFLQTITVGPQTNTNGFDGTYAYNISGGTATIARGADEDTVRLAALFYRGLRPQDVYSQAHTLRKEKFGGKDVYVVSADLKLGRYTDLLFFDAGSGLVLRCTTLTRTPLGPMPRTTDFGNYREVDGVKLPIDQMRSVPGALVQRLHVEEIRFNEQMDDAKFALPLVHAK